MSRRASGRITATCAGGQRTAHTRVLPPAASGVAGFATRAAADAGIGCRFSASRRRRPDVLAILNLDGAAAGFSLHALAVVRLSTALDPSGEPVSDRLTLRPDEGLPLAQSGARR